MGGGRSGKEKIRTVETGRGAGREYALSGSQPSISLSPAAVTPAMCDVTLSNPVVAVEVSQSSPLQPSSQVQEWLPLLAVQAPCAPQGEPSQPVGSSQASPPQPSSQAQEWLPPLAVQVPWLAQGFSSQPVG